jgi:hypothetical protein
MPVSRKGKYLDKQWVQASRSSSDKNADWVRDTRMKLRNSTTKLWPRLVGCAMGEIEMTMVQLRAAEIVMRKVLPDLVAGELEINDKRPISQWSNEDLARLLASAAGKAGVGETFDGISEPVGIH